METNRSKSTVAANPFVTSIGMAYQKLRLTLGTTSSLQHVLAGWLGKFKSSSNKIVKHLMKGFYELNKNPRNVSKEAS